VSSRTTPGEGEEGRSAEGGRGRGVTVVLDRDRLTAGVAMRAGLYAGVSTVEQEPENQLRPLRTFATAQTAPTTHWAHNPKVAGSNPAPATIDDEGLADASAANPFRLPRLHPGIRCANPMSEPILCCPSIAHGQPGGSCRASRSSARRSSGDDRFERAGMIG
jgi:hypothetical protein